MDNGGKRSENSSGVVKKREKKKDGKKERKKEGKTEDKTEGNKKGKRTTRVARKTKCSCFKPVKFRVFSGLKPEFFAFRATLMCPTVLPPSFPAVVHDNTADAGRDGRGRCAAGERTYNVALLLGIFLLLGVPFSFFVSFSVFSLFRLVEAKW